MILQVIQSSDGYYADILRKILQASLNAYFMAAILKRMFYRFVIVDIILCFKVRFCMLNFIKISLFSTEL